MPIINRQDAEEVDQYVRRFFSLPSAGRVQALRRLFAEKLDFVSATGAVSLAKAPRNVALPSTAERIASMEGLHVVYVPLSGATSPDRVRKAEAAAAAKLIADELHGDLLLVMTNPSCSQLHVIWPTFTGAGPSLRRMIVERDLPRRTAVQQLSNIYWKWKETGSILSAVEKAFDVDAVTKQFFEEYKRVFESVMASVKQGFGMSEAEQEAKKLFVQTLFNRLMFIYFLSRKGWLAYDRDKDYLNALWRAHQARADENKNFYADRLRLLFFAGLNNPNSQDLTSEPESRRLIGIVPFLNGGLFDRTDEDNRTRVVVPDDCFQEILSKLFDRFNFTVMESTPFDVEVAVDPEMLGKVFEELVTGRHESGSYYTPRPVVSFMCREALKGYLETQNTGASTEAIASFVDHKDSGGLTLASAPKMGEALARVKVVDPACGSGAYLLGMMQELVELMTALYSAQLSHEARDLYNLKLRIIQQNLYGADIDRFAVNIAMLRLWLSLAIEYDGPVPPPLPNLDFKIACGDSLLGPDPSPENYATLFRHRVHQLAGQLSTLKDKHMRATGQEKTNLTRDIEGVKTQLRGALADSAAPEGAVDWRVEFAEVFDANGGFDIVISNPPYLSARRITQNKEQLSRSYRSAYGSYDIYVLFFERGLQLVNSKGFLCLITSNKFLVSDYGKVLRQILRTENTLHWIVDLAECRDIFNALISPSITLVSPGATSDDAEIGVALLKGDEFQRIHSSQLHYVPVDVIQRVPTGPFDIYVNKQSKTTLDRLERNAVPLSSLGLLRTGVMGFDYWVLEKDIHDVAQSTDPNLIRIVTNSQVEPFQFIWGKNIKLYKETFKNPRLDMQTDLINPSTRKFFRQKKIVMRGVARHTAAAWDDEGYALLVAVHGFVPNRVDPFFLTGLLNSRLFDWFHRIRFYAARIPQGSLRYPISFWRDLPIRMDDQNLVREISANAARLAQGVPNRDLVLDRMERAVMELYEVSEHELIGV